MESILQMTPEDVRELFRQLAFARGNEKRGDFLTFFSLAVVHADPENFEHLLPLAMLFIVKYRLTTNLAIPE